MSSSKYNVGWTYLFFIQIARVKHYKDVVFLNRKVKHLQRRKRLFSNIFKGHKCVKTISSWTKLTQKEKKIVEWLYDFKDICVNEISYLQLCWSSDSSTFKSQTFSFINSIAVFDLLCSFLVIFLIADFNPLLLIFKFQINSSTFKVYALNLKLKFLFNFHFTCKTTFQTEVCVATVSEMRLNAKCPGSFATVA